MHYRSIFISDIHLGSRACQADKLCDFLKENTCDHLYLVGDIIDGWRLKRKWYFPQSHVNVLRRILTASKKDTEVSYIIGNHDEALRKFLNFDISLGRINFYNEKTFYAKDGTKILITHGDKFDKMMLNSKWLMHLGDSLYNMLIWINIHLNSLRRFFGMDYWSLSKFLKTRTKQAVSYINSYEGLVIEYCKEKNYNAVVCGHIHTPIIKTIDDVIYYNTGDWTDHCTAIVETEDGEFKLLEYENGKSITSN